MVKTPIKVVIRTRPTANFAYKNIIINENTNQISINIAKNADSGYVNHQQENWGFQFDKVLQNVSQEVIFDICCKDIILSALEGYSGTIICYGQTGAGKTFTTTGTTTDYKYRGLIPRCLSLLFQEIGQRYEQQITVGVSYLEIYNEQLSDLLIGQGNSDNVNSQLAIQEDNMGNVHVKNQVIKQCKNEEDAQAMIFEGETNKTISEHRLNKQSSRSHSVFTVHLEIRSRVESTEKVILTKINLVDLAGSERTKKTGSEGQTLLEAQFINKSLSFLEQVVVALSEKQRDHIPYRQSKLTNLLKDSIGGNSKTMVICNIWPEIDHLEETISTLKFATRMMKVSNDTSIQMKLDPTLLLKKYEKEIKELKQELAMHDTLANRGRITYDQYTPEQQYEQQVLAKKFLDGAIEDIEFESLRQVKELFFQFRNLYKNLLKDVENKNYVDARLEQKDTNVNKKVDQTKQQNQVGVEENKFGFGLGKSSKDARPQTNIENLVNIPKDEFPQQKQLEQTQEKTVKSPEKNKLENKIINVDKKQSYQEFKDTEGKELNLQIVKNVKELKENKEEIIHLTNLCNEIRQEIEKIKIALDKKQENKNQEEIQQGIIDEEEYQIMQSLKEKKKDYKLYANQVKELKSTIIIIDQTITNCKNQLLSRFEEWFQKKYGISINDIENPLINQPSEDNISNNKSEDIDQDALAYIRAKKMYLYIYNIYLFIFKVSQLQKARKIEKNKN
ncbi:kinesin family member 9, putative [Ichthyophthirius multifiliis]|uniref:Kinesin family member 9, putative n=1 Tax=Ichthyophthirius multifiliis TaxID=5932 RepID=G0QLD7_ICHMU|nr:kinesin family member 9, putative [Ichthyophthirius multifiliis]EGR33967.1 kinesin family member 9, putative [Ichthyophthirius multifiliis]|eukprot:XP_004039271.1 kinesin family member 9, putative [Ichthyophthirius multifiliis]